MDHRFSRRDFLKASAVAGLGLAAAGRLAAEPFKTTLHKAVIVGTPAEAQLKSLKDAGFEGVEAHTVSPEKAAECRKIAEDLGMRIHSVMNGGSPGGLRAAQGYGADAVLHVPGGVGAKPIPEPWEFDIELDETNGHITRLVQGDNEKFKAYIEAHNHSMDNNRVSIAKLIPIAEETKVVIALENVWNNFCVRPELLKWLVASFKSPWVKAYFDVGNHVKYAAMVRDGKVDIAYPPERWIRTFGPLLAKVHIKDYKLNADGKGGNWAKVGEGSVNWPEVRKALDEVGYNGWITDESGSFPPKELSRRFDLIIAGKDPGQKAETPAP